MNYIRLAARKLIWCREYFKDGIYGTYLARHEWLSDQSEEEFDIFQQLVYLSESV